MILGIDASNIRVGGGVTHLVELLSAADPRSSGFERVLVWSRPRTLALLPDREWLEKVPQRALDRGLLFRVGWQRFRVRKLAKAAGCDLLFVPGGSDSGGFHPMVTMNRNLLPFDLPELRRFGWTWMSLKLLLLRLVQTRAYRRADGVVFLTDYAKRAVLDVTGPLSGITATIPHGVDSRFSMPPRPPRSQEAFTIEDPCRVLYVSVLDVYKHQWHVAEAVGELRRAGLNVELELVGPPGRGLPRLLSVIQHIDPNGAFIHYRGAIPHGRLHEAYRQADIGLFASSCETFGQILTESMSAGLPIACSSRSAMPELLGPEGVYFDPETPSSIAEALKRLILDPKLRSKVAMDAFVRSEGLTWRRCSDDTFSFLAKVATGHQKLSGIQRGE